MATPMAELPSVAAVFRAAAPSMSAIATRAPSDANLRAMPSPIPRAAPVTIATLFSSFIAHFPPELVMGAFPSPLVGEG